MLSIRRGCLGEGKKNTWYFNNLRLGTLKIYFIFIHECVCTGMRTLKCQKIESDP